VTGEGAVPPVDRSAPTPRLSAATTVVGVIGDPVDHSLSPLLHNTAFAELGLDWVSVAFPVPAGRTADALDGALSLGIRGLSVTMPHKADAARHLTRLSPLAARLDAVNCVVEEERHWRGENTDGAGLLAALWSRDRFDPAGRRCLVVGAGGAARAVLAALADAGAAEIIVVNRSAERAVSALTLAGAVGRAGAPEDAPSCDLVVNATPVGMAGVGAETGSGPGSWPIDPSFLHAGQVVVDLVYHPAETPWMQAARAVGVTVSNGLGMLVHQAALQVESWTGLDAPVEAMWRAVEGAGPG
jgi:shikimate dehydrogenase